VTNPTDVQVIQDLGSENDSLVLTLGRQLGRKTPKTQVRRRPGPGNMMLSYIPWALVARRMNELFGPAWSFEYLGPPIDKNGEIIVGVRIKTPLGIQEAYGGSKYLASNPNASYSDALGGAGSKALRRACARLGIGLDLYAEDEEVRDEDPAIVEARAAFKAHRNRRGMSEKDVLFRLGDAHDRDYKSITEVVQFVMEDQGCSEVDAIWNMIETL